MSSNDANNQAAITGHAHGNWPRFELVRFPQPAGDLADLVLPLLKHGAPKALLSRYHPLNELKLVEVPVYGQLICFGICANEHELLCLNPTTGAILAVIFYAPYGSPLFENMHIYNILLVNASLAQFIASVRAIYEHFPFDEASKAHENMSDDEWDALFAATERTAKKFRILLRNIDSTAVSDPNEEHFWDTFLSDLDIDGIGAFY